MADGLKALRPLAGWALAWIGAVVVVQCLVAVAPGDAIDTLPDPSLRVALAAEWGLDAPMGARVARGTADAMTLHWGHSWTVRPGARVLGLVGENVVMSLPILLGGWMFAVVAGLALRGSRAALISAFPLLILVLAGIEGINGLTWAGMSRGWWSRPAWFALPIEGGLLRDAVLIVALGTGSGALGEVAARLRSADALLAERGFVLAARVRGDAAGLLWRHRVVPLLETAAAALPAALSGLVIVERLGARPGLGDLLWRAVEARDLPVATGVVITLAGGVAATSAVLDIARRAYDPRLRRS